MLYEIRGCSAFRGGLLCPRRQSNQNAAETALVSDFPLSRMARAWLQRKKKLSQLISPTKNHLPSVRLPALEMKDTETFQPKPLTELGTVCAAVNRSPVDDVHSIPLHHEPQTNSAAHTNKSVCLAVRGPAGEPLRDESGTVPQLPKACFHADTQSSQHLKTTGYQGCPLAAFPHFCPYKSGPSETDTN